MQLNTLFVTGFVRELFSYKYAEKTGLQLHKRYAYTVWFTPRASCDKTCNTFGLKLLYLCKSTYFHIVNGRLGREFGDGVFTFACRQGASVIDYVLARECDFANINMFSVHDFSEFSDHCPISFSLN